MKPKLQNKQSIFSIIVKNNNISNIQEIRILFEEDNNQQQIIRKQRGQHLRGDKDRNNKKKLSLSLQNKE